MSRLFRPIRTDAELRAAVTLHETTEGLYLDFKCRLPKDAAKEAKVKVAMNAALDVAAFANTWGGTLLIGIKEEEINGVRIAGEVIGCHFEGDRKWVEQVIRDRLVPPDVGLECVQLNLDGKMVMAVNVAPDDRLIAVWDRVRATYFPIRNNQGNAYMSPSEIVERASISARAGEIKLRRAVEKAGWLREQVGKYENVLDVHICSGMARVYTIARDRQSATEERLSRLWQPAKLFELESDHAYVGIETQSRRPGPTRYEPLYVPFGVVKEAWRMGEGKIGLVLGMRVVNVGGHNWALEQYGE